MTTKELIEYLQQEDPNGTSQVIIAGQILRFVERVEGYHNGSYIYPKFDENGYEKGLIISNKDSKIVLHCYNSLDDYIFNMKRCKHSTESILNSIEFDLENTSSREYAIETRKKYIIERCEYWEQKIDEWTSEE